MDSWTLLSYLGAVTVGGVLGLLGGGGSILTIPLLVYGFRLPPVVATGYSLFIVGIAALAGSLGYMHRRWLSYRLAFLFVAPSALVVHVTRHYIVPALPETLSIQPRGPGGFAGLLLLGGASAAALWMARGRDPRISAARRALALAVPAVLAVTLMRGWLLPSLPERAVHGTFVFSRDHAILWLLALVLLASGLGMLRGPEADAHTPETDGPGGLGRGTTRAKPGFPVLKLGSLGVLVGILTGILGAGGGFLVTPALVMFARLPIRVAVGTSLLIISANSLAGFAGEIGHASPDWPFLLTLTGLTLAGVAAGSAFSARLPGHALRRALGLLLTGVAVLIVIAETAALRG
jgi:uncharacterized membrane protein YfcA